jgi:chorismate mutase
MKIQPVFDPARRPLLVAGPCSAETPEQVLNTARQLRALEGSAGVRVDLFRAGLWKPRTRPGAFEGVGAAGLPWLRAVQDETGLKVTTEVATSGHVEACLQAGVDVLWIGARTTVNPFSVQEVADALQGVDVPVLVKNPVNPDYKLWIGAIERLHKAGLRRIAAVHRGFSVYGHSKYRNVPQWQLAIDLMQEFPGLEVICDISHICGRRDILAETAQKASDLHYHGLMIEVHPNPDQAWSDALQQITPQRLGELMLGLIHRTPTTDDPEFLARLDHFRALIDELDEELIQLMARRMRLVREIGSAKKDSNVAIFQPERWKKLADACISRAERNELSRDFIRQFLEVIHQESISQQERVMNH